MEVAALVVENGTQLRKDESLNLTKNSQTVFLLLQSFEIQLSSCDEQLSAPGSQGSK